MSAYQVLIAVICCTLVSLGIVGLLTAQGVAPLTAFLSVYLSAVWIMVGMQRRASQMFENNVRSAQHSSTHHYDTGLAPLDDSYEAANDHNSVVNARA